MSEEFAAPSTSTGIDLNTLSGSLLVFDVLSIEPHVPTVHTLPGEKTPAIRATVFVIDGPAAGDEYVDALIFPKVLQSQLRASVGRKVLGRLGKGIPKPGKSAAWELAPATADDTMKAVAWSNSRGTGTPTTSTASEAPF